MSVLSLEALIEALGDLVAVEGVAQPLMTSVRVMASLVLQGPDDVVELLTQRLPARRGLAPGVGPR